MGLNSRRIKERAAEICDSDEYQEARDVEFSIQLKDFLEDFITHDYGNAWNIGITKDDIQGFIDSFDFPDEDQWAIDKACNDSDEYGDQRYEEMKDRRYEDDRRKNEE